MDIAKIVLLLKNSGLKNITVGSGIIEFDDPSCIYTAFDNILEFGWIVIVIFTAIMLFGWAVLYIKNGIKINSVFNNAKTVILIFCILSAIKPIINVDDLFARMCDRKSVSLSSVQELYEMRNKQLPQSLETELYEIFDMKDSGVIYDTNQTYPNDAPDNESNNLTEPINSSQDDYVNTSLDSSNRSTDLTESTNSGFIKATYSELVTIYTNARGEKIQRSGGSVAWRNNNPGNIRKSKVAHSFGAIGETDKWAVFPDEETGLKAIMKLLKSKNYRNLSIANAIHRWAPSSDGNNPENYSRKISKMTGLPANTQINKLNDSDLKKVANAIKIIEVWTVGKEEKI